VAGLEHRFGKVDPVFRRNDALTQGEGIGSGLNEAAVVRMKGRERDRLQSDRIPLGSP
jgi:hypothetical protein